MGKGQPSLVEQLVFASRECQRPALPARALVGMKLNKANLKKVLIVGSKAFSPFMHPRPIMQLRGQEV